MTETKHDSFYIAVFDVMAQPSELSCLENIPAFIIGV